MYLGGLFGAETPLFMEETTGFSLPENERMTSWKISTVNEDVLPIQDLGDFPICDVSFQFSGVIYMPK